MIPQSRQDLSGGAKGFEPEDFGLFVVVVVVLVISVLIGGALAVRGPVATHVFRDRQVLLSMPASAQEPPPLQRPPAGARLQRDPAADVAAWRADQERILSSYARLPDGTVRIPIDRAIDILVSRGGAP